MQEWPRRVSTFYFRQFCYFLPWFSVAGFVEFCGVTSGALPAPSVVAGGVPAGAVGCFSVYCTIANLGIAAPI